MRQQSMGQRQLRKLAPGRMLQNSLIISHLSEHTYYYYYYNRE
jgi:hypothetical protein